MREIIEELKSLKKTVSTMESCTGGYVVSSFTNVEGASSVVKFSAVTYSNEYKIKMGVDEKLISKYSVYSEEVAKDMALKISEFADSDIGIGITGKINKPDLDNYTDNDSIIYVSIYDREKNTFTNESIEAISDTRENNKKHILTRVTSLLKKVLCNEKKNK